MNTPINNFTRHIQHMDNQHHLHPFSVHHSLRKENPRVITKANGVYIWDSEGRKILDGMSGLWCVNLGYGHKELETAALHALQELPYYNSFFKTTTPPTAELAQKISEITPNGLDTIFFASSGSEANDTAVKLIWYYWNLKNRPEKKAIIARNRAYHGSTIAAASLCGLPHMQDIFDLPLPRFHHIDPPPHAYAFIQDGESETDFAQRCARSLEDKILELGADNVAAFIGEPVMGAGGLFIPPQDYWQHIERICKKYDILLWADEVICGFGRTGNWFGCQTYGFTPDLITMAKGLSNGYQPISALALNGRVGRTIIDADTEMAHGYTYSGHPVASAVALQTLELIKARNIVGKAGRKTSHYLQTRLKTLQDHPLVGEVRGIGFLSAIELVRDKAKKTRFQPAGHAGTICRDICFDNDIISRAIGDTMILAPPLIISPSEIDLLVEKMRLCLDLTHQSLNPS